VRIRVVRAAAVAVVTCATAVACGGGSAAPVVASSTTSSAPVLSSAPGGLVGVIDRARLLSVCTDLRQASTLLDGGLPASQVDAMVLGAARLLERPPRVRAGVVLAARLRAATRRSDEATAVRVGLAFCAANGG
jgi:hypothetical protein